MLSKQNVDFDRDIDVDVNLPFFPQKPTQMLKFVFNENNF